MPKYSKFWRGKKWKFFSAWLTIKWVHQIYFHLSKLRQHKKAVKWKWGTSCQRRNRSHNINNNRNNRCFLPLWDTCYITGASCCLPLPSSNTPLLMVTRPLFASYLIWLQRKCIGVDKQQASIAAVSIAELSTCVYVLTRVPAAPSLSSCLTRCLTAFIHLYVNLSLSEGSVVNDTRLSVFFSHFFIYLNAITGLTSESQARSNYLLKDKCVSYILVNIAPSAKKRFKKRDCSDSNTYSNHSRRR